MKSEDILGPGLTHDSQPYWARLRENDPVHWDERHKAWLFTRYEDVMAGFVDPRLSSDRIKPLLKVVSPERRKQLAPMLGVMSDWLVVTDAPTHTRVRKLANAAFRQQQITRMSEWISQVIDELLDEFIASGSADFVEGLAYQLPATVIARMMGAPASDGALFQRWSDELSLVAFGAGGDVRDDRHRRALEGVAEMQEYLNGLIEQAKANPGTDIISALLEPNADGDQLTHEELLSLCTLILFAGHETTTNVLCNSLVALTNHPESLAALRADPSLVNTAVEEILRYDSPIKIIVRWVAEDHERGGKQIRAGDRVYLVVASANRDPAVFTDADTFDITRPTQPSHVAFGRGAHACLGAQLARIEVRIALPKIIERLPDICIINDITWKPNVASRAVTGLQVSHNGQLNPLEV